MARKPMAKSRKLKVNLSYTKEEFGKIKAGSIARSMEDKWDIVYEDDWLQAPAGHRLRGRLATFLSFMDRCRDLSS